MGTRREGSPTGHTGRRKRVKYTRKKQNNMLEATERLTAEPGDNKVDLYQEPCDLGIFSIPTEMLLEILSYLDCRDMYALRRVSKFFERLVLDPRAWTAYEVNSSGPSTSEIIDELKRMPHLKRISIEARNDCDDILKQLSCSNKKIQRLNIADCTGSSANLYLRSINLIRILERCPKLHTITIKGSRFRGLKFYRLLGYMGHRLRFVSASTTCTQFRTFAKHVSNFDQRDKDALCSMCTGSRQWGPLRYYTVKRADHSKAALVSYFYHDFLCVYVRPVAEQGKNVPKVVARVKLGLSGLQVSEDPSFPSDLR